MEWRFVIWLHQFYKPQYNTFKSFLIPSQLIYTERTRAYLELKETEMPHIFHW